MPAADAPVVSRRGGQRGSQLAWGGGLVGGGRALGELTGSVPALVPGFCGWSWAEGDPQRELIGWAGAGLPGTAIPQGLSVCPVLESGALKAASGWAVVLSAGLYPYRCLSLVEVFVAEQGCAGLLPLPRWWVQAEESSAPATGWLLSPQTTVHQTHRAM